MQQLQSALAALPPENAADPTDRLRTLTYATASTTELIEAFRNRHLAGLRNPEARRQFALPAPQRPRMEPLIFSFSSSEFSQVELKDFFAPVLIHFVYKDISDLNRMITISDTIRRRAMYATVYSDFSAKDVIFETKRIFEDNRHVTMLNVSVFDEESGNFPFGGYGPDASSITWIEKKSGDPQVTQVSRERPLLFSQEALRAFPRRAAEADLELAPPPPSTTPMAPRASDLAMLAAVVAQADATTSLAQTDEWPKISNPYVVRPGEALRPRGLAALRAAIAEGGLSTVVTSPGASPAELEELLGTHILILRKNQFLAHVSGVVLHPSSAGWAHRYFNAYLGDVNPHLGYGTVHGTIGASRLVEYSVANAIVPGIVGEFMSFAEAKALAGPVSAALETKRAALIETVRRYVARSERDLTDQERAALIDLTDDVIALFMDVVRRAVPEGAFIKNYGESTTGDLGTQITTFASNHNLLARQFAATFTASVNATVPVDDFADETFQSKLIGPLRYYDTPTKFLAKLLTSPDDLVLHKRMRLAKTETGMIKEVRIDYLDGEPISGRPRYGYEFMDEEIAAASRVLKDFFERAPEKLRYMSGGADLVELEDGRWVIMELNCGNHSGTQFARAFPIEANRFISALQGKSTPLIARLEAQLAAGTAKQYLAGLHQIKELWMKASLRDLSLVEAAKWFRDELLRRWLRSGQLNGTSGDAVKRSIRELLGDLGGPTIAGESAATIPRNPDMDALIRGGDYFVDRTLGTGI